MNNLLYYVLTISLSMAVLYMTLWFIISLILKRNDVADFAWGIGFVVVALVPIALTEPTTRSILVTSLVAIWGIRLSTHILSRNRHKPEDPRYTEWRQKWGKFQALGSFLQVFLLQALMLTLIITPVLVINSSGPSALSLFDIFGVIIWIIGFTFEAVGDAQLKKFISNPENKGQLMTSGLWKYTRHPNYFGETTMWWGLWVIALGLPFGVYAIVGPIVITLLLTKVSGVPLAEKNFDGKPGFDEYKRKTSVFIPWFPKK